MTKTEALQVLGKLPPMQKVRLLIETGGVSVDSNQCADYHIYWLTKEFHSPVVGSHFGAKESDCIKLESISFEFALAYNSVMEKVETPIDLEYTKEQEYEMFHSYEELKQYKDAGRRIQNP